MSGGSEHTLGHILKIDTFYVKPTSQEEAEVSFISLTCGQGGADPSVWAILMSNTPSNHNLGGISCFVATLCCQQL